MSATPAPFVVFDVLYRLLRHVYGAEHVTYVRNITDIDDKIIDQAAKERRGHPRRSPSAPRQLPRRHGGARRACPPTHEPRATEYIAGMIALIER